MSFEPSVPDRKSQTLKSVVKQMFKSGGTSVMGEFDCNYVGTTNLII